MKKGVRIIICARGGIVDEKDLRDALDSGKVAGAALDVFAVEPATDNILFGHPNVVCTPHLGAATVEAQVNVALQVADQMADFLTTGAVSNAVNMPSISAEDAPRLKPYLVLAEQIGAFAGQITDDAIKSVNIAFEGPVAEVNTKPLTQALIAALLKPHLDSVNRVNALSAAEGRGIAISETKSGSARDFRTLLTLTVTTESGAHGLSATLFGNEPRIVSVEGVPVEAALTPHMLFLRNADKPGMIGRVGSLLGEAGQNIADFRLGRKEEGGSAVCLICLDSAVPDPVFKAIAALPQVTSVKRLRF